MKLFKLLVISMIALAACGNTTTTVDAGPDLVTPPPPPDMCPPVGGAPWKLHLHVKLMDDGKGVALGTQNGSVVHVAASDIAGKGYVWATAPGGAQIANVGTPMEFGFGTMTQTGAGGAGSSLTADIDTTAIYPDGPWEMAFFISITGGNPMNGPQQGDIAGFSIDPVGACEPKVTGVSFRMSVRDADASLSVSNTDPSPHFIRF